MIKTWKQLFEQEKGKMYSQNMHRFISAIYQNNSVFPAYEDIFKAFSLTPLESVKVVILGQDPYHQKGQAMGLAFSVPEGISLPPSLKNIYKEMSDDLDCEVNQSGDLTYLGQQGVLLLNTIFTVEENKPLAHDFDFYKVFIETILKTLNEQQHPIVFILWGNNAKGYQKFITNKIHLVLTANHPSPLSANRGGFFKSKPFSKTNAFLEERGKEPIKWIKNA